MLGDKTWRMTNLYKIKDKSGELITFKPNSPQIKHLLERGEHRRNLILKARQFGFTTLYCIDELDEALWVPGMTCAITAHDRESLDRIFEIVKRAYNNLDDSFKPITKYDTKRMLQFTHRFDGKPLDSAIYVAMKLRSGTTQRLHITESSKIKDRAELDAGSKQTVPMDGWISEETTGNGFEAFYDTYTEASLNPNPGPLDYKTYFYAWFENPEYSLTGDLIDPTANELEMKTKFSLTDGQLLWRRWKIQELKRSQVGTGLSGEQLFKQEYPATVLEAFQSGAGSVFDQEKISAITPVDPLLVIGGDDKYKSLVQKGVRFWRLPEPGKRYDIGVDPSDGEGADFTDIDVWIHDDSETQVEQCAQFYGKVRPDESAELIKEIAEYYNNAFVGVENNMLTTILFLSKIYDNYYFENRIDEKSLKRTKKIGWSTNIKTRDVMIDDFNIYFDEGHLLIHSKITLNEMKTFVKKDNGKREHADGKHDDSLFGAMIAIQMRKFDTPKVRVFEQKPF